MIDRFAQRLDAAVSYLGIAAMGAMTAGVIVSVVFRYFFSLTAAWSEELIGLLFVTASFLGCIMAVRSSDHIGIDLVYEKFGAAGKRRLRIASGIVTAIVQVVVFDASLGWIAVSGNVPSPGLEIPFAWIYSLLPASCVLIVFYAALKIADDLRSGRKDKAVQS